MSKATLTLDGLPPLEGTAESGGDYIRFQTDAGIGADELDRLHKGQIEIDGKTEKVMLKSAQPHGEAEDAHGKIELTLQRFQPSSV
ncbi:hypothetical protein [Paracoccus benzoatiresistens]|uniref:Uncharacterized protein n=1 Tax=Paracoccus benzoatiresistens TaxID=2997341 RepID=A0ABT4J1N9_9RHOB|nr:hypothetical protein [Paracoccus sp. EF6]MCZ0961006.1 hypothetical protein [Paracoccus sp. EF6]